MESRKIVCKFFNAQNSNSCMFGQSCRFSHDVELSQRQYEQPQPAPTMYYTSASPSMPTMAENVQHYLHYPQEYIQYYPANLVVNPGDVYRNYTFPQQVPAAYSVPPPPTMTINPQDPTQQQYQMVYPMGAMTGTHGGMTSTHGAMTHAALTANHGALTGTHAAMTGGWTEAQPQQQLQRQEPPRPNIKLMPRQQKEPLTRQEVPPRFYNNNMQPMQAPPQQPQPQQQQPQQPPPQPQPPPQAQPPQGINRGRNEYHPKVENQYVPHVAQNHTYHNYNPQGHNIRPERPSFNPRFANPRQYHNSSNHYTPRYGGSDNPRFRDSAPRMPNGNAKYQNNAVHPSALQQQFRNMSIHGGKAPSSADNDYTVKVMGKNGDHLQARVTCLSTKQFKMVDLPSNICFHYLSEGKCGHDKKCRYVHVTPLQLFRGDDLSHMKPNFLETGPKVSVREMDVALLKKTFPSLKECDDTFRVVLEPQQANWPYDCKKVPLKMVLPKDYPKQNCSIEVEVSEEYMPETLLKHLNSSIQEWCKKQFELSQDDSLSMLQPFLHWINNNLEDLFTEGLKQELRIREAQKAGFQFVSFTDKPEEEENKEGATGKAPESSWTESPRYQAPPPGPPPAKPLDAKVLGKGAVAIVLDRFVMSDTVATVLCRYFAVDMACKRCDHRQVVKNTCDREIRQNCEGCREQNRITFHPRLMHAMSSLVGYLVSDNSKVFDVMLPDWVFDVVCMSCNASRPMSKLCFGGSPISDRCINAACIAEKGNTNFTMSVESFKIEDSSLTDLRKTPDDVKKKKTPSVNLGIQHGKPLPNQGACEHYKKSFRWFRFPCCGRTYPCDVCHNAKEDHDIELANKMLCGFCAKEQPVGDKPCISCSNTMNRPRSTYWEGGKGCRNKVAMCRNDEKKYAGVNKTVSKKKKLLSEPPGKSSAAAKKL